MAIENSVNKLILIEIFKKMGEVNYGKTGRWILYTGDHDRY